VDSCFFRYLPKELDLVRWERLLSLRDKTNESEQEDGEAKAEIQICESVGEGRSAFLKDVNIQNVAPV